MDFAPNDSARQKEQGFLNCHRPPVHHHLSLSGLAYHQDINLLSYGPYFHALPVSILNVARRCRTMSLTVTEHAARQPA